MSFHKGLIGKTEGGASAKNLQNSEQATARMKQDVTLKDYIERKTDNRGELGNWPFPVHLQRKPTKDTFKTWWTQNQMKAAFLHIDTREAELIWKAAQENM